MEQKYCDDMENSPKHVPVACRKFAAKASTDWLCRVDASKRWFTPCNETRRTNRILSPDFSSTVRAVKEMFIVICMNLTKRRSINSSLSSLWFHLFFLHVYRGRRRLLSLLPSRSRPPRRQCRFLTASPPRVAVRLSMPIVHAIDAKSKRSFMA